MPSFFALRLKVLSEKLAESEIRSKSDYLKIGSVCFGFYLTASLLLQFVVLPILMPHLYAGNGLMVGGDWLFFHFLASDFRESVEKGILSISDVPLRLGEQFPASLLAVHYLVFGFEHASLVLPVQCLIMTIGTLGFAQIVMKLVSPRAAFFGVLVCLFMPSSLLIYGQVHKDVWSLAGLALILNGLLIFCHGSHRVERLRWVVVAALGFFLVWTARPYLASIFGILSFCVLILGFSWYLIWYKRAERSLVLSFILLLIICLISTASEQFTQKVELPTAKPVEIQKEMEGKNLGSSSSATPATSRCGELSTREWSKPSNYNVLWLLDRLTWRLTQYREGWLLGRNGNAGSNIDICVRFGAIEDVLGYLPRALQIGLLAPFPTSWITDGKTAGGSVMRRVIGLEMSFIYFSFGLAFIFMARRLGSEGFKKTRLNESNHGQAISLICIVLACLAFITFLATTIPNVGTIVRMRSGAFLMLVSISVGFVVDQYFGGKNRSTP